MPAWTESGSAAGDYLGAKIVNVFPGNSARGVPVVAGPTLWAPSTCACARPTTRR
jgi:ornithine cyclodeaminase/alanine dehydrogenase-like protein (mu-crystallin family)